LKLCLAFCVFSLHLLHICCNLIFWIWFKCCQLKEFMRDIVQTDLFSMQRVVASSQLPSLRLQVISLHVPNYFIACSQYLCCRFPITLLQVPNYLIECYKWSCCRFQIILLQVPNYIVVEVSLLSCCRFPISCCRHPITLLEALNYLVALDFQLCCCSLHVSGFLVAGLGIKILRAKPLIVVYLSKI
jgi:hypothetical protein